MTTAKKALLAGAGLGAAVLGAGAVIYEGALNTKLNAKLISLFDHPDPGQEAIYNGDAYAEGRRWFDEHKGPDETIETEDLGRLHAYVIPAEAPTHRWAVLCHGYNSDPKGTCMFAVHYHAEGYHIVCPSLRGWGNDETRYCTMGYHDQDVLKAWIGEVLRRDPAAEIVLHGYSMGAVTVMLATGGALPGNVKAAVCDCGFSNCYDQFANVLKSYTHLPPFPLVDAMNLVSILRGNFNFRKNVPIDAVGRSVTPTIFLHGTADDFVPFSMMEPLYEACAAPKARQPIEGGFHATSVLKDPDTYWRAVDGFLAPYLA